MDRPGPTKKWHRREWASYGHFVMFFGSVLILVSLMLGVSRKGPAYVLDPRLFTDSIMASGIFFIVLGVALNLLDYVLAVSERKEIETRPEPDPIGYPCQRCGRPLHWQESEECWYCIYCGE